VPSARENSSQSAFRFVQEREKARGLLSLESLWLNALRIEGLKAQSLRALRAFALSCLFLLQTLARRARILWALEASCGESIKPDLPNPERNKRRSFFRKTVSHAKSCVHSPYSTGSFRLCPSEHSRGRGPCSCSCPCPSDLWRGLFPFPSSRLCRCRCGYTAEVRGTGTGTGTRTSPKRTSLKGQGLLNRCHLMAS